MPSRSITSDPAWASQVGIASCTPIKGQHCCICGADCSVHVEHIVRLSGYAIGPDHSGLFLNIAEVFITMVC